jgi:serine/threonine protein kinase
MHTAVDAILSSKYGYTRQKRIGSGTQGNAYLVKDARDGIYVMKELTVNWDDQMTLQHAMSEVGVVANLSPHPHIVALKESFITAALKSHTLHLITEYCPHGDLDGRVATQAKVKVHFNEDTILNWLTQLFAAVRHLHDRNILHRDLKGANIFLNADDTLRLGDFGLSFPSVEGPRLKREMTMLGTPFYASPELLMKAGYAAPNDIWGLGVVAYDLMQLRKPFEAKSVPKLLELIVHGVPASLPSIYTPELQVLVFSMLEKEPAARPTITQLLDHPLIKSRYEEIQKRRTPSPLPPKMCSCYLTERVCSCGNADERGPGGAFAELCKRFHELRFARRGSTPSSTPTGPAPSTVRAFPTVVDEGPSGLDVATPTTSGIFAPVLSAEDFKTRSGMFLKGLQELSERYGTEATMQEMQDRIEAEIEALRTMCEREAPVDDTPLDSPLAYGKKPHVLLPPGFEFSRPGGSPLGAESLISPTASITVHAPTS